MIVRCGACRTEFDVSGEGRHPCPTCGAVNQVAAAPQAPVAPQPSAGGPVTPSGVPTSQTLSGPGGAMPTVEPTTLRHITCGECSFEFVVGDIDVAACPNCSAEVSV